MTANRSPSRAELIADVLAKSCAPEDVRVGLEVEALGLVTPGLTPLGGDAGPSIHDLLTEVMHGFGGDPIEDGGILHGVKFSNWTLTVEPGGQFEFSGPPESTVVGLEKARSTYFDILDRLSSEHGIRWLWLGVQPLRSPEQMPFLEKPRYTLMRSYLPTRGTDALRMMQTSASVQVTLDGTGPIDLQQKFQCLLRVAPFGYLFFANSPYLNGRANGARSNRAAIWQNTDSHRCGIPARFLDWEFGVDEYVDFALDVPMFFLQRQDQLIALNGSLTFRQFMENGLNEHRATLDDFRHHLSTLFYDVRMKGHIEFRPADCVPENMQLSVAALVTGLVYNRAVLADLRSWLEKTFSTEDVLNARHDLATKGFEARFGKYDVVGVASELLALAAEGLKHYEPEARGFLDPLFDLVHTKETLADRLVGRLGDDLRSKPPEILETFLPIRW
ncbi:MAG: hypothetical protein CMH54_09620 [Myxococcales bacterium]|nr:hypothetical protein [Myxococcales bacterium]